MKKLIGMSLVALLAITSVNTAVAQDYITTKIKNKDGKHKEKRVPASEPHTVIYTTEPVRLG